MYQCNSCKKQFTSNQSLKYHINKGACKIECKCDICGSLLKTHGRLKTHIDKTHNIIQNQYTHCHTKPHTEPHKNLQNNKKCNYCSSHFSRGDSLKRHLDKYCKIKKEIELNETNKIDELEKKLTTNDNLSKDITLTENTKNNNSQNNTTNNNSHDNTTNNNSHNTTNNTTNNNTTNNNSNNTTINFVLNKHGEENLSYITDSDYLKCFKKGIGSLQQYILIKHFNDEHPENANLYIDNIHSEYCKYYDGKKFIIVKIEDIIMHIIDENLIELDDKHSELKEKVYNKAIERYETFIEKYNKKEGKVYNDILVYLKDTVRTLLYNEKGIAAENDNNINKKLKQAYSEKYIME